MRIELDLSLCREYANCVVEAPDVFDIDEVRGKAIVLDPEPDVALHDDVRRAAASCPVRAIRLVE